MAIAQRPLQVEVKPVSGNTVAITVQGKPFTSFFYPDTLEKPVLYPVYAPDGQLVTRGFPLKPRPGEPTDHPHHIGIWLNYESVNGLDFWNNSFAIPASKKPSYGWIRTDSVVEARSGKTGQLTYTARWEDHEKKVLLRERTTFLFTADKDKRIIDRITTLTAVQDVAFPDIKDGLLGMRVAKELQIPANEAKTFTDNKGIVTTVEGDKGSNGNYITSEGKQGNDAWATRARWCMLYGKLNNDTISIAIIDHPQNPGYPTYWHARGYGLFAANPLGQKIFSNGKENLDFKLKQGQSTTFRYRIVVAAGGKRLAPAAIERLAGDFGK